MSTPRRERLIYQLGAALIASIVVIAALILAVVAIVRSSTVGTCVNDQLGDRNPVTQHVSDLEIASLEAVVAYDHQHTPATRAKKAKAQAAYLAGLRAARDYRAAHPLGDC